MKLNIGSGVPADQYLNRYNWTNIDISMVETPAMFFEMDVFHMPLTWVDRFTETRAIHVLEHVNRNKRQQFVDACFRVTATGGICRIEVPNFPEIIWNLNKAIQDNDKEKEHIWTTSIYGKQRWPGDSHCWGYNVDTLGELMQKAGFINVVAWTSGPAYTIGLDKMVSGHYKSEPVLLMEGWK
jgi:predicted SAM-dependent methyltransferase